ncbi:hypothetical protein Leryth_026309, partial [Lithospermum erythrorhizon]
SLPPYSLPIPSSHGVSSVQFPLTIFRQESSSYLSLFPTLESSSTFFRIFFVSTSQLFCNRDMDHHFTHGTFHLKSLIHIPRGKLMNEKQYVI